jgi:hypothetical protein
MNNYPMFDERISAQAAAGLLFKAGGRLPWLKLVQLMYLAEILSVERYGASIVGDTSDLIPHGPALPRSFVQIAEALQSKRDGWSNWLSTCADDVVTPWDGGMIRTPEDDLLALSDSDLECLGETWAEFGHWDEHRMLSLGLVAEE